MLMISLLVLCVVLVLVSLIGGRAFFVLIWEWGGRLGAMQWLTKLINPLAPYPILYQEETLLGLLHRLHYIYLIDLGREKQILKGENRWT